MAEGRIPPEDESSEVFDLDLEDQASDEADELFREAVEAVEQAEKGSDPEAAGTVAEAEGDNGSEEVTRLNEKIEELEERELRNLAELENFRKRAQRERDELKRYAVTEPFRELLEVLDNLERALSSEGTAEDVRRGVEMILQQMRDVLRRFGVQEVEAVGEEFDPAMHDAVVRQEDPTIKTPTVTDELQRGYVLHDRLLRPARVRVAIPLEEEAPSEGEDEGESSEEGQE